MPRFKSRREAEEFHICDNSIERVINTSMEVLHAMSRRARPDERLLELASVGHDDWCNLKEIVVRLWNEERDRIFRRKMEEK